MELIAEGFVLAEGPVVTEDDVLLVSDVLVGGVRRFGEHATWSVVGWRASDAARQFVADRLGSSGSVPTATEVDAAVLGSYRPA